MIHSIFLLLVLSSGSLVEEFTGKVVGITDGDTIRVLRDGNEVRIRLEGIDCPEIRQAFSTIAKQATSGLVFDKNVTVRVKGKDRYDRLLADIVLPDGTSLNRELVRSGFAWWFKKYSKDESLGQLEAEARAAKRRLWADKNPIPPWDWRQTHRSSSAITDTPTEIEPNGIEIVAVLPNPAGLDQGHEEVTLANSTAQEISLKGWHLRDKAGNEFLLTGTIPAKAKRVIKMTDPSMSLNNDGDEVLLFDSGGVGRSRASYSGRDVVEGREIEFRR